jgi:GMP synthase C terminal domain
MTADFYSFDMAFPGRVAAHIVNEVRGVNRVVVRRDQQAAGDDRMGVRGSTVE